MPLADSERNGSSLKHSRESHGETSRLLAASSLVVGVFLLDLLTPSGVLIPVLYVIPILIALRFLNRTHFVFISTCAALFTVLGLFLSPGDGASWMVYANRSLALITIIAMGLVYVYQQQTATRLHTLQDLLPQCASCKKVRDDIGYWSQLELYLEEHRIQQFFHSLCPLCERQYQQELLELKQSREKEHTPF